MKQLDDHLTQADNIVKAKTGEILKGLALYLFLLGAFGGFLYLFIESFSFSPFRKGDLLYNIQQEIPRVAMLNLCLVAAGHVLQKRMYPLFNQSIVRSALVPVLFLNIFLIIGILVEFNSIAQKGLWQLLATYTVINSWLLSISLYISWYFQHLNKWLYVACFVVHTICIGLIMGFSIN